MTDETSNQDEQNTSAGVKWREPTIGETAQFALTDNPFGETDREAAAKADMIGKVYFDLLKRANEPVDPKMDDDTARAEAVYFSKSMTGLDDVPGKLWRKGGFATGKEYLAYMRDFFRKSPQDNKTQELRDFEALDEAGQTAAALDAQKTTDWLKHLGGNAATALRDYVLRYEPNAVIDIEREEKEKKYQAEVRSAYHAKLLADNAWIELSGILPRLSEDGRECTKALMESPDNKLPTTYYAKFNNLPDEEKQMLIRARTVLAPRVEGGFWNTIGDMGVGLANISASLAAAPVRFGNKLAAKYIPGVDDFFDINEISRRRQYLWQATGDFAAGGGDGFVPQLQFEQICEDHGFVAEALIGAVTTLPYMAAAAVPGVGVAEVALEAMSEMDDHVAMAGGDITDGDYMLTSAILGAMYAYAERLQVEGLLGGVSDLKVREAMLKGVWAGIKDGRPLRNLAVGTFSESLQEGVQNGIMSVNEALALKGDAVRAFGEGFTEDFVGSLGTMFVVESTWLVGGHVKRSGYRWGEKGAENRSTDLEAEYGKLLCQRQMVDYEGQSAGLRTAMQSAIEGRLYNAWKDGGKDALVQSGIDPVQAEEWDYYFRSEREWLAQEEETGEAVPMDKRSVDAQRSLDAYLAKEAKKIFDSGRNTDADLAAFDLAMENLDWVRSAWAQGRGIFRQDGDKTLDPGAKALEKLGFTPDVAARLSRQFHYERAAAYSPAALAGIKSRYEERMKDKVTAVAALAEMFGGRKVRIEDADYIQFDGKDGSKNLVRIDESPAAGIDFTNADEGIAVDVERATDGKVTKADWMAATENERRQIWNDYGLVHEGSFGANRAPILVTVSADPSAKVDQSQAAKLIGTISIDATTDPNRISDTSSGFHEVFHAFSYFAQASGLWTDEDIAYLKKTFGKAKHSQERFDEEAAAEAFRSFLARRAAGAMTADDERSPFARIYAAAAGLDRAAAEKAVQTKMQNESENAFFHQLIAEANKPTPPAPKPTLSKSDAPQKGIAPVKENAEPVKQNGTEVKQNAEPVKQNGTEVKQNAAPVNADAPKTWSAYTPTGNIKVSGHWAVLDLKDVIHSNNPLYAVHMRAQLRNRKDNKAEEDTRKDIVNNFQGERLLEAPDTANGAPIVFLADDENGIKRPFVLSGNGRVLVLNELADRHLYDHYRNVMKKWAAENGIIVPEGQTPILVRVIDDYGGASRDKVADLSNTNSIQQYTEEEQARADAEVIKSLNIARLYVANVDGSADMTPGVNDEFFSEFIRGVGDTSLYNSDRSLTQTARDRAQRALLAIAVGQGDRGRDVVKKLVEQTETLNIQRQKNAAAIIAAQVAALETNAAYAIGPDVSRAMADFMDYAEKKKAGKVGNFAEYYAQMDLIDAPSPVARAILQLFGSDKSAATIAEYVKAYCKAASMEDPSGGLFGAARTREEIWNDAAKLVDEELKKQGVKPVAPQPTPVRPAPVGQPTGTPAPAPTAKPAPVWNGKFSFESNTMPTPSQSATPTETYTVRTKTGTFTGTIPVGGQAGLRPPYDPYTSVPESPNPIRSLWQGIPTTQKAPDGTYWGDKLPRFQGHKTEMFDRTVMTLRQKFTPEELAKFDTVVDYFGGGGCWGMSLALTAMPNVKRIIINEFDPGRLQKIELLQTLGGKIVDEVEKMMEESGTLDDLRKKMQESNNGEGSGAGTWIASRMQKFFEDRFKDDPKKLGLFLAIEDCIREKRAGSRTVDGKEVKITFEETWKKALDQLRRDGENAKRMRDAIEKRGGTVEYVNGDSTKDDFGVGFDVPSGGNVMAVADPPYYRTQGYDGSVVGLEKKPMTYSYEDTRDLMKRLVDKGDGIVYTDEAWWLKQTYLEEHRVRTDTLTGFDDADAIAVNKTFRKEHGILKEIRELLDHFDNAGWAGGNFSPRQETLGVHHGTGRSNEEDGRNDAEAARGASDGDRNGGTDGNAPDGSGITDNTRHSVQRVAGRAEDEARRDRRSDRGSGQRSEDVVREVNAAVIDALPDGTYGFPGQLATLERIIRHSVRSVREDKQKAYAKTVAKNAKAYLARTASELDARMKAAGYTEKVWHGHSGNDFNVFRFSADSHDVPAAYFSYDLGTAENYAALRSLDTDEEEAPNVRGYYINPGKMLTIDETGNPPTIQEFIKKLAKAYEDGYDSVRVKGALDDQGMRIGRNDEILYPDTDSFSNHITLEQQDMLDNFGALPTDILIVMQHDGENAATRIKAADPITFWDEEHGELPIPPEMRANKDIPDLRFSIQAMGKNAEYRDALKRPDANERTTRLAPNGKRSNLSNALYWLVRTKRFKDWFGDWEAANLFNLATKAWNDKSYIGKFVFAPSQKLGDKLKDLLGHEINEVVITADSVRHMKKHHGDAAYEAARGQVAMTPEDVATLPYILNNFDVAERNPTYDMKLGNKSVDFYKRINGVSVVATISMGKEKQFVVSGWKILSAVSMSPTVAPKLNALNDADIDIVQKEIAEIKRAAKDCSKVVDENGEPKPVYHSVGSWYVQNGRADFNVFDGSIAKDGFMFRGSEEWIGPDGWGARNANGKGRFVKSFLNIRNPLVVDAKGANYTRIPNPMLDEKIGYPESVVREAVDENERQRQSLQRDIDANDPKWQNLLHSWEYFTRGNGKYILPDGLIHITNELSDENGDRFDGVIVRNVDEGEKDGVGDDYITQDPYAIKSADPDLRIWAVNNGNAPWQTEDVPQAKQIITYGDGKMTDINGKPVARHSIRSAMQDLADGKEKTVIHNETYGDISYPLGSFGKLTEHGNIRHGLGLLHIVFARMAKEGATLDEAIDTAIAVADAAEIGTPSRDDKNRLWLDKDGTRAVVAKNADGKKIITGYEIYADEPKVTNRASSGSDVPPTPRLEDVISALKSKLAAGPESTKGSIAYPAANVNGVEQDARRAITAMLRDGDKKEAQDALENYVAYFKLAHGPLPRPRTIARIGLSLGMNVVDPKRILKNADKLAERMRGTAIEKAAGNGDVGTAIAMMKREKDLDRKFESILAGGVSLGSQLTHKGVGQINALTQRRVERMMNDFTAATLADMEGDTGINLAAEILENNPDAFETEYRKAKKLTGEQEAETAEQQEAGSDPEAPASDDIDESEMSDADRYKRQVLLKEAAERVAKFIEEAKARAAENNAQAADRREKARQRIVEAGDASAEGEGSAPEASASGDSRLNPKPSEVKAGFKTPEEFAAFLRVWTADKFAKTHGLTTIGQAQQNKLFAEYYRICARQELQDLADKLLAPKMLNAEGKLVTNAKMAKLGNGARAWVNRRLQEMEKGIRPDRIERMSADIFAFINKAAVRVSRVDLITNFKKNLKERFLHDPDFDEFKQDTERKVTGWVEEATRYICRVCDLSKISVNGDPSQLEQEYRNLHEIIDRRAQVYDESGREVAAAAQEDAETLKAQWKLALLDRYGAMRSMMPGEILDLQNAAFQYLEDEAAKLEQAWKDTRAQQDQIRRDFTAAIVGPNGQKYQAKGIFSGRLFDALNGMIRLRLQHLTRFASDTAREKAKDAINSLLVMLGDGETAYAKALQEDREAFFSGLGQIFQRPDGTADNAAIKKYLERLDEPIPRELSEKVSNQGYVGTMTHGQLLQLLVSLEQRSFKDAIKANGREGQAELIRNFRYLKEDGTAENVVTAEDSQFIEMLRAFYAAKRDQLSAVTERMVGHKVDSPDPLYCPVRRWIDDKARSLHTDPSQRWDPISKIFSRRVESDRDFDESRTIIGLFFENSKESAKLTAWAERGSFIRNIVTSVGFQASVKRAFGNGELGKILKQLEATFNGGEVRSQTPGEVAAADKAVNFVTYAYLGFNPLSALKQTTSPFVWANVLDGGFADLWRHMTHFDKNVLKHLMESDEYKVRYGNKVGSGMDYATKGLNMNPSENPAMRFLAGAGMWMLKRGDFIPGGWIAQGVYKDMLNKHMSDGMDYAAADRLAITETFNLLEETQQSGRTYNTNMLQIEHGRIGRLLTQFATSPLQQLQYETQAWREWRDMVRYNMGEKKIAAARQKLVRAVVINHLLLPAALNFVTAMFKLAMGDEPPWEKDGYHWSILTDVLMGQFSRVFFIGAFSQTALKALFMREYPRTSQMLPVEGALGMAASVCITAHDVATLNAENIRKDLERMLKATAPTRIPYGIYRRLVGDSDMDRKKAKKGAGKK